MNTTPTPIQLDLRRDLPKVREAYDAGEITPSNAGQYRSPCALGFLMSQEERKRLDNANDDYTGIVRLIDDGLVSVPAGQRDDCQSLQDAFDTGKPERFDSTLAELEAKYLARGES